MRLVLASASPRRRELLAQLGITDVLVAPMDVDETANKNELPLPYVKRVALLKAAAAVRQYPDDVVLTADTVVAAGRRMLPKAETAEQVRECLELLSGRRHKVLTAVAVSFAGKTRLKISENVVKMQRLSASDIDSYAASGDGIGKAGGYALQGRAAGFISWLSGSPSGIIGLPLHETALMLETYCFQAS
ncbi:MAG: Maf family protein [Alphaproteobacteria bacterium]|nr:Maf family protein [Alphaproteobacteria bacterium]